MNSDDEEMTEEEIAAAIADPSTISDVVAEELILLFSKLYALKLAMESRGLPVEAAIYEDLARHVEDVGSEFGFTKELEEQKEMLVYHNGKEIDYRKVQPS